MPSIQVIGEFGRVGDMLPSLTANLLDLTPYGVRVSALYGEGGLRLLAAPDSAVNPYVEATAGIARLTPHVSGFGAGADAIAATGLRFLRGTDPSSGSAAEFSCAADPSSRTWDTATNRSSAPIRCRAC